MLPTSRAGSVSYLTKLIILNGGKTIDSDDKIDKGMIVLINDSFIDKINNCIISPTIFKKQCDLNFENISEFIFENKIPCVSANCVSLWLTNKKFSLENCALINILDEENEECGNLNNSSVDSDENSSEAETETEQEYTPLDGSNKGEREGTTEIPISLKDNNVLIEAMDRLFRKYETEGDSFRSRSYKLAKGSIQNCPFLITSGNQARQRLQNIGPSIAKKIQFILDSGMLTGLDESAIFEKRLNYFKNCYDVGPFSAKRWDLMRFDTFDDVIQKEPVDIANEWPILFGWSYYEDWSKKILRVECLEHLKLVKQALKEISLDFEIELQGSYIREKEVCGDIDILFYKENCDNLKEISDIYEKLILKLHSQGYIKCMLQLTPTLYNQFYTLIEERYNTSKLKVPYNVKHRLLDGDKMLKKCFLGVKLPKYKYKQYYDRRLNDECLSLADNDKYMSLNAKNSINDPPCRRLDFFCCKWSELGAARMHYTGSGEFNRWIRILAAKKGFKLTQHGLYKDDQVVESFNERRIFDLLGVEYVPPKDRSEGLW